MDTNIRILLTPYILLIVLSTGFDCVLRISFPGRSSLKVSFHFMGIEINLLPLTFETLDAKPDRIPSLLADHVKTKAPALLKIYFKRIFISYLRQLLRDL